MFSNAAVAAGTVFSACHVNVFTIESMIGLRHGRDIGYALTFLQCCFVGIISFLFLMVSFRRDDDVEEEAVVGARKEESTEKKKKKTATVGLWRLRLRLRPRRIPLSSMLLIAGAYYCISSMGNMVFQFGVSVPTHAVFRSSSLLFSMALGWLGFRHRYTILQVACVCVIVAGLVVLTLLGPSGQPPAQPQEEHTPKVTAEVAVPSEQWWLGIALMLFTSLAAPLLGLLQERVMNKAAAAPSNLQEGPTGGVTDESASVGAVAPAPLWAEVLVFSHLFGAAFFLVDCTRLAAAMASFHVFINANDTALAWTAGNLLTQWVCTGGVNILLAVAGSFVMTLTLTIRKFISLLFSLVYFGHYVRLGPMEWAAILSVAGAATIYPFLPKAKVKGKVD